MDTKRENSTDECLKLDLASLKARSHTLDGTPRLNSYWHTKEKLHAYLNRPFINLCIAVLILLSVFLIFAELTTSNTKKLDEIMKLNNFITWIFILELSLRYWTAPNKRIYFSNYWIDILSVIPAFRVFRSFRVLRLLRLLRLFRAGIIIAEQSGWLSKTSRRYMSSMLGLAFSTALLIICGSLSLLAFEGGGSIESFTKNFWTATFLFVSGEFVNNFPASDYGRLVAALVSISGLIVFAILVGTISASMTAFLKSRMETKDMTMNDLSDHLIICGWDNLGKKLLSEIEAVPDIWLRGVVIVSTTEVDIPREVQMKNSRRFFHIKDDFTKFNVLEQAGAKRANTAIVLSDKGDKLSDQDVDARSVLAALTLEKLNPNIYTCAELLNEDNATHLKVAGVEEIVSRTEVAAGLFALSAINRGINFVVSDIFTHYEGSYLTKIPVPHEFIGKEFLEIFTFLKRDFNAIAVGIDQCQSSGDVEQHVNPASDYQLKSNDRLTLILHRDSPLCKLS